MAAPWLTLPEVSSESVPKNPLAPRSSVWSFEPRVMVDVGTAAVARSRTPSCSVPDCCASLIALMLERSARVSTSAAGDFVPVSTSSIGSPAVKGETAIVPLGATRLLPLPSPRTVSESVTSVILLPPGTDSPPELAVPIVRLTWSTRVKSPPFTVNGFASSATPATALVCDGSDTDSAVPEMSPVTVSPPPVCTNGPVGALMTSEPTLTLPPRVIPPAPAFSVSVLLGTARVTPVLTATALPACRVNAPLP